MREYKPVLISLYDLFGEITKDGDVTHKYIEYDGKIYHWNGRDYIDENAKCIANKIYIRDCKKPMIKLLDYVYDIDYNPFGKSGDDNEYINVTWRTE